MQVIFVYEEHDNNQKQMIERVKNELSAHVSKITVMNVDEAKDIYHISRTPAVILIREDLQGEDLLGEGIDDKLLLTAMIARQAEEEEAVFFDMESNRLDNVINTEKKSALDEMLDDMLDRGVL